MRILISALVVGAMVFVAPTRALAQEAAPAGASAQHDGANPSAYRTRVFQVKNRRPSQLVDTLRVLGSGAPSTQVGFSDELGSISVRDFPENISAIGDAINRLDVPEAPATDVELHLHVLLASRGGAAASSDLPQEIRNAVVQLQNTLAFTSFALLAPLVQRVSADGTERSVLISSGQLTSTSPAAELPYACRIERITRATDSTGAARTNLGLFRFDLGNGPLGTAQIATNLSLRDGEQVVVGTAMLRSGQALVLVVSARPSK